MKEILKIRKRLGLMEYPIPTMKEMLEVATVDLMIIKKDAEIKEKDDIIKKLEDELNKLK